MKQRKHIKGFVDYNRQIKRPELGSTCGLMPEQCAKDIDFHYEEIYGKNWATLHQNFDFGKQLPISYDKFDKTKTLKFIKNKPEQIINYNKIFKKFEEHEVERIINENLKHHLCLSEENQAKDEKIKA